MQIKRIHYALAALSFLVAFVTYTTTMQPSIPFWDCGEFIGAAAQLGISHPPGTPLWTLVGHVLSWFVPLADLAARYNFLSATCGALSAFLLYLTAVKVIRVWRGEPQSIADAIVHFGGALVAALSFTYTDSVWFNSSEFIVFAPGLLLIALIIWLGMCWHERAGEPGNEKYLMLIAYIIGLSIGVHQMSMLAFFPVFAIVYYKHQQKVTAGSFLAMLIVGVFFFLYIFFVVLTGFAGWLGGAKQGAAPVVILLGNIGIITYLWRQNATRPLAKLLTTSAALVFLGFSTYTLVMVRGDQNPPMNQHSPSNFSALHEYIARLQYGEAREWPRRDDRQQSEPLHDPTWGKRPPSGGGEAYTSDMDFMWRYQMDHMYFRYLRWNFVGRDNDNQDAGTNWSHTWGIPLFIGLIGFGWHVKRDPKRALAFLGGFMIMGLLTALYQNQQDAQPRERDYFYVGAFWIYAMWVGIGVTGIMELLRVKMAKKQDLPLQSAGPQDREVPDREGEPFPALRGQGPVGALAGVLLAAVVLIPLNQCIGLIGLATGEDFKHSAKWAEYSREHNNFPLEYAYNILQSCDPDGVIFTAGDNDTFPLWCIQDLYHVRTDVRIVNLSLGNMGWYIKKLKDDEPWGGKKLKLPSFTEEMLNAPDDSPQGVRGFAAPPTMVNVSVNAATMAKFTGQAQPGSFSWKWTSQHPYENGQYIYEVADQLIKDIVVNNINERPIYFAVAVPSSYWTGLDQHVVFEGFTARIVPTQHAQVRGNSIDGDINEPLYLQTAYNLSPKLETKPVRGCIMNTFRDPRSNRSGLDERYASQTYFEVYGRLANYYFTRNNLPEAHRALDTLMARMPPNIVDWNYDLLQEIGHFYQLAGDSKAGMKYIQLAAKELAEEAPPENSGDENAIVQNQVNRANLYYSAEMYDSSRAIFSALRQEMQGRDQMFMDFRLAQIDEKVLEKRGDKKAALKKLNDILVKYQQMLTQLGAGDQLQAVAMDRDRLAKDLGMVDSALPPPVPVLPSQPDISNVPAAQPNGKKTPPANKK